MVRVEEDLGGAELIRPMLWAICDFIGQGDALMTPSLRHLGENAGAVLEVIRRLEARGAHLKLLEPETSTDERSGRAVVRALEQLVAGASEARSVSGRKPPRRVDFDQIRALRAHGMGPSQIAQTLGVSRMTVWRALSQAGHGPVEVQTAPDGMAMGAEG